VVVRKRGSITCRVCNKKVYRKPSLSKKAKRHYCSNQCKGLELNGSNSPTWKGGVVYIEGRKMIHSPYHPYPNFQKKYVFEYRLILEKHLKRFLLPSEIVHHKDENIQNNKVENLEVLTQSEHAKRHYKDRKIDAKGRLL